MKWRRLRCTRRKLSLQSLQAPHDSLVPLILQCMPAPTPSRARFSVADDIELLREVRECNPFANPLKWAEIARTLSEYSAKAFTARAVRERAELLLSQYAANDRVNLRKSGTEEQYREREQLLQELIYVAREGGHKIRAPRRASCCSTARSEPSA
ncbi:uncharacterized protein LOC144108667 [Amblyomma americanum]